MSERTGQRWRDDLKSWPKNGLIREVRRLRALVFEQAPQMGDPARGEVSDMVDVAGDPLAHGGVVLDVRDAVLMDRVDVAVVDPYTDGRPSRAPAELPLALMLGGRINGTDERSRQIFLFPADGAASIVVELLGLAERGGPELAAVLAERIDARMAEQPSRQAAQSNNDEPEEGKMDDEQQTTQDGQDEGQGATEAAQGAGDAAQGAADAAQGAADAAGAAEEPGSEPEQDDAPAGEDEDAA